MAYLSALLEQHPYSEFQPNSHKVEVITRFLEDVVHVVPLESIAYAIAYGKPEEIAIQCAEALIFSKLELPPSQLMELGLRAAGHRLKSGVSPDVIRFMEQKAHQQYFGIYPEEYFTAIDKDSKQLTVSLADESGRAFTTTSLDLERLAADYNIPQYSNPRVVNTLYALQIQIFQQLKEAQRKGNTIAVVCGINIEQLYPVIPDPTRSLLKSPLDILKVGKERLSSLSSRVQQEISPAKPTLSQDTQHTQEKHVLPRHNSDMLEIVNKIREGDLAICTSLLGGFMEQQEIDIPLVKSRRDHSQALRLSGKASVGVWALSSLDYSAIQPILARCHGNQLLVKIEDYVKAAFNAKAMASEADNSQYAAKLQFMVQGVRKVVTCNTQYVSYSLERQLSELCEDRKIDTKFPPDKLVGQWAKLFEENILSLVAISHRPLIARWLMWALMVHNLREELAKYTAVGVVGLVNSGKSRLVNTLFGIKVSISVITLPVAC